MGRKQYKISHFKCKECRKKMYIPRIKYRKRNHIKDMYCYLCKRKTKFIELGEYN